MPSIRAASLLLPPTLSSTAAIYISSRLFNGTISLISISGFFLLDCSAADLESAYIISSGKSSGIMISLFERSTVLSITFLSSLIFPFHWYTIRTFSASLDSFTSFLNSLLNSVTNLLESNNISSPLSFKEGSFIFTTFNL